MQSNRVTILLQEGAYIFQLTGSILKINTLYRYVFLAVAIGLLLIAAYTFSYGQDSLVDIPATHTQNTSALTERWFSEITSRSTYKNGLKDQIDQLVIDAIQDRSMSGAVVLVAKGDQIIYHHAHGHAQLFSAKGVYLDQPKAITNNHLFDLASLTKVFATTYGIMLLKDRGLIDLDAPVKQYLPSFSSIKKDEVTIRHLLTHSAGLFEWKPLYYHATNAHETLKYISRLPLAYPVGEQRRYSDLGFMLLGYIIESASGQSLDTFLKEALYDPLGLEHTSYAPVVKADVVATSFGNPFEKRMVADPNFGFRCTEDSDKFQRWRNQVLIGEVNDGNAYHANEGIAGHAGLFATATDLHQLLQLLLDNGVANQTQIIQESTIDEFLTQDQFGNGLGWAMSANVLPVDSLPDGAFGHTGFTGTYVLSVPKAALSIILLTNRQHFGVDESGNYPSLTPLRKAITNCVLDYYKL